MRDRKALRAVLILLLSIALPAAVSAKDLFVDSGQRLGEGASWQVALGDVDGDGDLDAVVANEDIGGVVWLNDGTGHFTDSGQRLSVGNTILVADLDGDQLPDVLIGSWNRAPSIWWNDGTGAFSRGDLPYSGAGCLALAAGDLDGDSALDVFVGRENADYVLMNAGNRTFVDSGQRFGNAPTAGVAIGDMDGDGDLDVVAAGWDEPGHVWANDGAGVFASLCELAVSTLHVHGATLADYESDGDLDVFFALAGGICCRNVWLNDGLGQLSREDFNFGSATMHGVAVGDFDSDGDQDVALAVGTVAPRSSTVWLGEDGDFVDSGLQIGSAFSGGLALGDLDGDGDLDLFLAFNSYRGYPMPMMPHPNEVWINGNSQPEL